MKRILFFLLAFSFVLSVSAQDIVRTRNCRPKEPVHHVVQQAARRAPVVASNNPYIGDRRQLVVMVVFKDQAFSDDKTVTMSKWNKILNARNYNEGQYIGSFHDYFYEQSYGQLNINCDMYYMEVDSMKKYRSTAVDDENSKYLVQDVVNNIKSEVDDWSPYDWENDGYVNQLLIIYSGKGQNDGGDSNTIWPHQCWLSEHDDAVPLPYPVVEKTSWWIHTAVHRSFPPAVSAVHSEPFVMNSVTALTCRISMKEVLNI